MHADDPSDLGVTRDSDTLLHQSGQISFDEAPEFVEEFSIRSVLGRGGFGTVYLAFDTTLQREVALKVPHRSLVERKRAADNYLREARAIASLDHRAIIPVYRASSTADIPCYIVTKRIRGCHLGQWRKQARPPFRKIAEVIATVADALGYAHKNGIVHRDVKPGNILIDQEERPYVADFGLALRDADPRVGSNYVGTPSYMSPEQARGEGHRVDGRSDLFSLGSVLYELLTGSRPFHASDRAELYEQILYRDPDDPVHLNPNVPLELARICMKLLAKSISDRYASAELVAAELRAAAVVDSRSHAISSLSSEPKTETPSEQTHRDSPVDTLPTIVPKGLRSFSMHDSEFYPQLLPGPYDREGVPESIRFWLSKLDPNRAERAMTVGLIYGPSGCGKTSFVRAGILPRLPGDVDVIYVQATPHQTEQDLISQIEARNRSHQTDQVTGDVHRAFASLRLSQQKRTVIFIDQFEQWLFTHPDCVRESLTHAIRQCDGEYLQCILMVRDDFWMGVTRLMQALDIPIVEHQNVMAADLFDGAHARKVLAKFGAAYGKLPDSSELLTPQQKRFLDAAVEYLESNGRVICVQLALLTEMLKNRAWDNTADLFGDGGASLGMRFFESTFEGDATPRRIHAHADGSLRVLKTLLPDVGSPIKGAVRTEEELWSASGYADRTHFRQLIAILDRELHLITPTDRQDDASLSGDSTSTESMTTGYQLTHDFLVAPIQQWVEYHSRVTKYGKAKLRLDEFSELYRVHPRPQSLPTFSEFVGIRRYLGPSSFNDSQQRMMSAALKRHCRSALTLFVIVSVLIGSVLWLRGRIQRNRIALTNESFIERFLVADMADTIDMVDEARRDSAIQNGFSEIYSNPDSSNEHRIRASLVTSVSDSDASEKLVNHLLMAAPDDVAAVTSQLAILNPHTRDYVRSLWDSATITADERIRVAAILVNDKELTQQFEGETRIDQIIKWLLAENPIWIGDWATALRPASDKLIPSITTLLSDVVERDASLNAVNLIIAWSGDDIGLLASLVPNARSAELTVLCDALRTRPKAALGAVQQIRDAMRDSRQNSADPSRPWGSPWWCVGDRTPVSIDPYEVTSEQLSTLLSKYEWVGDAHAIMAHQIPISDLESTNQNLEQLGYRFANASMYEINQEPHCFGLWLRDGAKSRFVMDASAEEIRRQNERNRSDGFLPDVVACSRASDGTKRFHGFWIAAPANSGLIDADIYVDVPAAHHEQDGWQRLGDRGLWLNRCAMFERDADGMDYFTSVRWRTTKDVGYVDDWNQNPVDHHATNENSRSLQLVSGQLGMDAQSTSDRGFVSVWWKDLPVLSEQVGYRARREHLRAARERFANGWYPVSINATTIGNDTTPHFQSIWWRGLHSYDERTREAQRLRNLAIACFLLGDETPIAESFQAEEHPDLRGAMIDAFRRFRLDAGWLFEQVWKSDAPASLRRGCAMALALLNSDDVSPLHREQFAEQVSDLYATGEPGFRSALEAVATSWDVPIGEQAPTFVPGEIQSSVGDRLVMIRPKNPVWLGSPPNEPGRDGQKEPVIPVLIDRTYAIATKEVTIDQFQDFAEDHTYAKDYAQSGDCPVIDVTWFDAARYCRWLSEQEGIPESQMCYPPHDEIKPGMTLARNCLDRIGYRLPTEAEWEYACRGGSTQSRWFGFDPDQLDHHAWTARNSGYVLQPVATRLPNEFGLFDMLGNAMDYCHTKRNDFPRRITQPIRDPGELLRTIAEKDPMINRGGAVLYQPLDARASQRDYHGASTRRVYLTFRIARTVDDSPTAQTDDRSTPLARAMRADQRGD